MRTPKRNSLSVIHDPLVRAVVQSHETWILQAGRQLSKTAATDSATTAGNIASISANGGAKRTGDLTFTDTSDVTLTQTAQDFQWRIGTLPAGVFAVPTNTYGTTYAAGTASTVIRSDSRLKFPSALMETVNSKTLTLTDNATYGALLQKQAGFTANGLTFGLESGTDFLQVLDSGTDGCSLIPLGTWSSNILTLRAPAFTANNALRIGPAGTISTGGTTPNNNQQLSFAFTVSDSTNLQELMNCTVTNSGTAGVKGATWLINNNSAAASAAAITGCDLTCQASGAGATGSMVGFKNTLNTSGGATRASVADFQSATATLSGTITTYTGLDLLSKTVTGTITGWRGVAIASPSGTGTITNTNGLLVNALALGTNRRAVNIAGCAVGAPTVAIGVDVTAHSVGTDRWSFRGANKFENTTTDFIASTASKGFITKDTQGTARYWRTFMDATGTVGGTFTLDENENMIGTRGATPVGNIIFNITDVGTALPTS